MPRSRFAASFAQALRRERLRTELTQEALAERAGLHPTYVSMVETAKKIPTMEAAHRLAKGLGVKLSKLVADAEKPSSFEGGAGGSSRSGGVRARPPVSNR